FFFSSRRRHTRSKRDWSSDVCSSDLDVPLKAGGPDPEACDEVMLTRRRVSRIYYHKKFFDYPVRMNANTIRNMGLATTMEAGMRSEEHTSELQSRFDLVCRLLLEKKK